MTPRIYPKLAVSLIVFFIGANLLYLAEDARVVVLDGVWRTCIIYVMLLSSLSHLLVWRRRSVRLLANRRAIFFCSSHLLVFIVTAVAYFYTFQIFATAYQDEILRLGFAHQIAATGLPSSRGWWVLNATGSIPNYVFAEYIAASLVPQLFGVHALNIFYFYLYPFLLHLLTAWLMVAWALPFAWTRISRLSVIRQLLISLGLMLTITLLVIFGSTAYIQGVAHGTFKQNSLALLLIMLAIVLCLHSARKSSRGAASFFVLSACMPGVVGGTKALYVPVACILIFGLGLCLVRFRRISWMVFFVGAGVGGALLYGNLFGTDIVRQAGQTTGGVYFSPFSLLIFLNGWIYPGDLIWQSASFLAFGLPIIALVFFGICGAPTWKENQKLAPLFACYWAVFLAAISGLFAGTFLRFTHNVGGAEAYWLISGWSASAIAFSILLVLMLNKIRQWSVLLIFCLASVTITIFSIRSEVLDKLIVDHKEIPAICISITHYLLTNFGGGYSAVIAHPWGGEGEPGWAVNGYCGSSTVSVPNEKGTYGLLIRSASEYEESVKTMNELINKETTEKQISAIMYDKKIKVPLVIVRDNPISVQGPGDDLLCEEIGQEGRYYLYVCAR